MSEQEYAKIIAKNLRRIMYDSGKTQRDVARDLRISKATVSAWMNGTRTPKIKNIDMLCHYFNVSRAEIMEEPSVQKTGQDQGYYINTQDAKLAQEMLEDADMRSLFAMKKNMDPEKFSAHVRHMRDLYRIEHPEVEDYD